MSLAQKFAWADHRSAVIEMMRSGATARAVAEHFGTTERHASAEISRLRSRGLIDRAPNTKIRFTPEMDDRLRGALAAGASYPECALRLGLSADVAKRRARALGLQAATVVHLNRAEMEQAITTGRAERKGFRVIAAETGASESSVRRITREMGLPLRLPTIPRPPRVRPSRARKEVAWTDERRQSVADMIRQNMSGPEIAKALGVTRGAIAGQIARLRESGMIGADEVRQAMIKRNQTIALVRSKHRQEMAAAAREQRPPKPQRPAVEHLVGFDKIVASFDAPSNIGVSIVDLDMVHGCRWPFTCDDGETRYCNARATDGSWCAAHGARVFAGTGRPQAPLPASFRARTRGFGEVHA